MLVFYTINLFYCIFIAITIILNKRKKRKICYGHNFSELHCWPPSELVVVVVVAVAVDHEEVNL